jgi:endonuclease YncB( thermonuclease family)
MIAERLPALLGMALLVSVGAFASTTATRVVDGDTIVVAIDGPPVKVRLIGVDTRERCTRTSRWSTSGRRHRHSRAAWWVAC